MLPNIPPKFEEVRLTEEAKLKVEKSFKECETLQERTVRCPYCANPLAVVFSDAVGHQRYKCNKCKSETVINLAYFRTIKRAKHPYVGCFGRFRVNDRDIY